jgi:hypothetical protein
MNSPAINCAHDALVATADLKGNPENPNKHQAPQLTIYAKILWHQGWRKALTVSNQSGFIVTGHGAWLTAKAQGWPTVPVDYQDFASKADELAHMVADNQLSQLSDADDQALQAVLKQLGAESLSVTGLNTEELDLILAKEYREADPTNEGYGNDVTDDVPKEKEVYIVPIALNRSQYRAWEKKKAGLEIKGCKKAFLKVAGLE